MTFIKVCVEVSCLLTITPAANSVAHTSQFGSGEVTCLLRFTSAANSAAHTLQFGSSSLISYWSRIRKNVTHREQTENRQTEKAITETTLIPWIAKLSGLIDGIFLCELVCGRVGSNITGTIQYCIYISLIKLLARSTQ